ncbi:MAG: hypothetical protein ISN26_01215 [Betaproteobacteria bacterium AqS2]|uniref:Uncharacterized protein n=1 Tax=Candidatus Amphirhobacter heronislandensis TaxID=1732024 RepID=A0A930UE10_9GAMM|nr:hypothetical protein [Betaproteobacteria bacterium AqS2]
MNDPKEAPVVLGTHRFFERFPDALDLSSSSGFGKMESPPVPSAKAKSAAFGSLEKNTISARAAGISTR